MYRSSIAYPVTGVQEEFKELIQVVGASLFIALAAQIQIPLFFTPVPLSGQTLAVLLAGSLLGSRKGILSVLLYLLEGCFGLPVFTSGPLGFARFLGPTGGYLIGFVFQAYLAGWFAEQKKTVLGLFSATTVQLSLGALWLGVFVGFNNAVALGFLPFLPGELLKIAAIATICRGRKAISN